MRSFTLLLYRDVKYFKGCAGIPVVAVYCLLGHSNKNCMFLWALWDQIFFFFCRLWPEMRRTITRTLPHRSGGKWISINAAIQRNTTPLWSFSKVGNLFPHNWACLWWSNMFNVERDHYSPSSVEAVWECWLKVFCYFDGQRKSLCTQQLSFNQNGW